MEEERFDIVEDTFDNEKEEVDNHEKKYVLSNFFIGLFNYCSKSQLTMGLLSYFLDTYSERVNEQIMEHYFCLIYLYGTVSWCVCVNEKLTDIINQFNSNLTEIRQNVAFLKVVRMREDQIAKLLTPTTLTELIGFEHDRKEFFEILKNTDIYYFRTMNNEFIPHTYVKELRNKFA